MSNRRDFIKKSGILGLSALTARMISENQVKALEDLGTLSDKKFNLPPLPYAYDALEPFVDKQTMELHHTKHHQAYIDKINGADLTALGNESDPELLCTRINNSTPALVRNNLGGHYNHSLFWQLLRPNPNNTAHLPKGKLAEAINSTYGSFEDFKKDFSDRSLKLFGSGWCWLILSDGKLKTVTTTNQDNPLMNLGADKGKPILALDVWEHAYYLKYQNRRAEYIANWWNIINWEKAESLFTTK